MLISAISLFMLFTKIQYRSNVINYLPASCLSIYLMQEGGIHCYGQVRELYLQHGFTFNFWIGISLLFVLSMSIPLAVDKLRLLIFSHVENKVSQLLDKHIFKRFFE